jgi:tetratricopeptide (TPR) repeat protein
MTFSIKKDIWFFVFLVLQVAFWMNTRDFKPELDVLPSLPGEQAVKATSFGDEQFYFRVLGLQIQNAGDTFGRTTPLKDYDYEVLQKWFYLLDSLSSESNFIPALAAYYFSQTQHTPDVRYIVDYLVKHADRNPHDKWWWYSQAITLSRYKLKDNDLALGIAYKLAAVDNPDMPIWAKQAPAFILEDVGKTEEALIIIQDLLKNYENLSDGEKNFMYYYINERLKETMKDLEVAE